MSRAATARSLGADRVFASERSRERDIEALPPPLVWTFDGPFERCLDTCMRQTEFFRPARFDAKNGRDAISIRVLAEGAAPFAMERVQMMSSHRASRDCG